MRSTLLVVLVLATACKGKDQEGTPPASKAAVEPAAAPAPKPAPPAEVKLVEFDLSPLGNAFKGYVASLPETAKLKPDESSPQITLSETDYVSISTAPYWEDGVASTEKDPANKNIKKISATEVQYESNPPLGTAWAVDVLVKIGGEKYSCSTGLVGTFTSAAMRDQIAAICKSIHKKS
jgi:hypothetical protein